MRKYQFVITEKCNQRCSYCYMNHTTKKLSLEDFHKAYNRIEDNEFEIDIFGGEPLLYWSMCKKIIYTAKDDKRCKKINLYTNGLEMLEGHAHMLQAWGVNVHLSFDGLWQDGGYEKYITKIPLFKEVTRFATAVVSPPKLNLVENYRFFKEIGMIPRFKLNKDNVWVGDYPDIFKKEFKNLCKEYETIVIREKENFMPGLISEHLKCMIDGLQGKHKKNNCGAGSDLICIGTDGTTYPCARFSTYNMKGWTNFRNMSFSCKGCDIYDICPKGCLWDNLCNDGPGNICQIYHIIFDELLELHNRLKGNNIWKNVIRRAYKGEEVVW